MVLQAPSQSQLSASVAGSECVGRHARPGPGSFLTPGWAQWVCWAMAVVCLTFPGGTWCWCSRAKGATDSGAWSCFLRGICHDANGDVFQVPVLVISADL